MATKKICDRCGAEINPKNSANYVQIKDYYGEKFEEHELCVSCAFRLRKWLSGEEGADNG